MQHRPVKKAIIIIPTVWNQPEEEVEEGRDYFVFLASSLLAYHPAGLGISRWSC